MTFRAFDLVPVITSIAHDVGDPSLKIGAVEAGGADLYLGTTSGLLLHYQYQVDKHDRTAPPSSALLTFKVVSTAPVVSLCLASALERLLVLVDDTLVTVHAGTLTAVDGYTRHRGVTALAVNPNPRTADPFSIQVCVARRRQLLVLDVTDAGLRPVRELAVPERVQALALNGDAVCAAAAGRYLVFQVSTGRQQPLFEYDPATVRPLVRSILQDEFLVLGPADLAMFALVTGTSERPPVQLGPGVRAWTYQYPYIITSDSKSITVISMQDDQLRQEVAVPESALLDNFDGTLLVCAGSTVLSLCPVPWQTQVQTLLRSGDLEASVALLESSCPSASAGRPLRRQLGLALLAAGRNARASELLRQAGVDPRELVSLVPGLLPPGSPHRPDALLSEAPGLASLSEAQLRQFLSDHVLRARREASAQQTDVDTALVLLLADQPAALAKFVREERPRCDTSLCAGPLAAAGQSAQLGQLLLLDGQTSAALALWQDVVQGRKTGDSDAALRYMAEALASAEEASVVRQFADCLLEADQEQGVRVFVERPSSLKPLLTHEEVCTFLKRYPVALTRYLEDLVLNKNVQFEPLSTQLAGLYLDRVVQCRQLGTDPAEPVGRLLALLRSAAPLRVSALLHRTLALQLHRPTAYLYARAGEYDKALELVVRDGGPGEALALALELAPVSDSPLRRRLFHALLEIHLRIDSDDVAAALELLNSWGGELESGRALAALPAGWSAAVVGPFLLAAARRRLHGRHAACMERSLARAESDHWQRRLAEHRRRRLLLPENTYCPVCHHPLSASAAAVYPNGVIVHPNCVSDPRRCPVTGQLYSV